MQKLSGSPQGPFLRRGRPPPSSEPSPHGGWGMGLQGWEELRNPRSLQEGCAHFPWRRTRQGPQSMSSPHTSSPLLQLSLCLLPAAPPISKGLCPPIHSNTLTPPTPPTPPILQPFQKGKLGGFQGGGVRSAPPPAPTTHSCGPWGIQCSLSQLLLPQPRPPQNKFLQASRRAASFALTPVTPTLESVDSHWIPTLCDLGLGP